MKQLRISPDLALPIEAVTESIAILAKRGAGKTGELAGYTVGDRVGGTYGNILGRLRSLGLIDYPSPGEVVALPVLFLEGALA